ncbi:MAG: Asp-tRNA(Asn)/Glu-tRNA(Gln) amidotransferase subunit GatC [Veillonella parvula]
MQYLLHNVLESIAQRNHPLDHELALSNAPEAEDGYFKVPRVVQE